MFAFVPVSGHANRHRRWVTLPGQLARFSTTLLHIWLSSSWIKHHFKVVALFLVYTVFLRLLSNQSRSFHHLHQLKHGVKESNRHLSYLRSTFCCPSVGKCCSRQHYQASTDLSVVSAGSTLSHDMPRSPGYSSQQKEVRSWPFVMVPFSLVPPLLFCQWQTATGFFSLYWSLSSCHLTSPAKDLALVSCWSDEWSHLTCNR